MQGCEAMQATLDDEEKMEQYQEKMEAALDATLDAPSDAPDDALDELMGDEKFKELTQAEYVSFKNWMDGAV